MSITSVEQPAARQANYRFALGRKRSEILGHIISWIILSIGGVLMALPFLWMISSSLKPLAEIYVWPPQFIPEQIQWTNYLEIWRRLPFHLFFRNSFLVAVLATAGVLFTSSLAGYSFARLRYPGRDQLFLIYLSTMMVPFAVRMIPLFMLMRMFGWVDNLNALILPGMFSAWGTFLMRQFMLTIPK